MSGAVGECVNKISIHRLFFGFFHVCDAQEIIIDSVWKKRERLFVHNFNKVGNDDGNCSSRKRF